MQVMEGGIESVEGVPDRSVQVTDPIPCALKNPACMKVDRLDQILDPICLRINSHEQLQNTTV
jgi:hypothetical protein